MSNNLFKSYFSSSDISSNDQIQKTYTPLSDTYVNIECKEFLPEVYDTWSFIHKLSTDTIHFREIYELYKYERSENQQKYYFDQLKILDDTIYKLSYTIYQRIQLLEKIVQPTIENFYNEQQRQSYIPAYIRIAENQLNSLKLSFKRIIIKHNTDSIDYQNNLKQSVEQSKEIINSYENISRTTIDKIKNLFNNTDDENLIDTNKNSTHEQIQLQILDDKQQEKLIEQEKQIIDLQTRLESVRILNERVRQMKLVFNNKLSRLTNKFDSYPYFNFRIE